MSQDYVIIDDIEDLLRGNPWDEPVAAPVNATGLITRSETVTLLAVLGYGDIAKRLMMELETEGKPAVHILATVAVGYIADPMTNAPYMIAALATVSA